MFNQKHKITNSILLLLFFSSFLFISALAIAKNENNKTSNTTDVTQAELLAQCPLSDGFDFPVGKPNAKGYYNAQKFGRNAHLGDDWNGRGGGNTDLGDPIYAVSDGIVFFAEDVKGGWGNVVRIYHNYGTKQQPRYIESFYAHLDKILVSKNTIVKKGQKIGTIGNVNGLYLAHLHLEIRDDINLPIGRGYSKNTKGYVDPTQFIRKHRKIKQP